MSGFQSNRSGEKGITLVELMVALAIGSILVLGLVQVFGASRAAYQMSEGLGRVQENARFAMDFVQRDTRMAGHFGCVNDQAHFVGIEGGIRSHLDMGGTAPGQGHPRDFAVTVQGYEANGTAPDNSVTIGSPTAGWTPTVPSQITEQLEPLPGSDILVLRYLSRRGTPVVSIAGQTLTVPSGGAAPDGWTILTDEGVAAPTMFGMADCSRVHVFEGSGVAGAVSVSSAAAAAELAADFGTSPGSQAALFRGESIVYYIAEGATGMPSLHRARFNAGSYTAEELVEGVESMQLLFGMDQEDTITSDTPPTGNITEHRTAASIGTDVSEWRRVGLVQVGLLMRSPDPAAAPQAASGESTDVRVLGVRYQPAPANDGRYRTSYEATIALRNRLFGN